RKRKRGTAEPFPSSIHADGNGLFGGSLGRSWGRRRQHVHLDLAARAGAERHHAVGGREKSVITADADILAGVHPGAALTDQDVARQDLLAAEALHAQPPAVRVAAVARGAACFLVCHRSAPVAPVDPILSGDDLFALDYGQALALPVLRP